ncbi:helix-turn-helix domain-containing protein [Calothrix sp. 336/3]|uniref:helix-turn-helix domain-containing protein n=1 Tax=Calothrix sp. 336/3 TaxID=1337936 RepID=UPI0004E30858|nr:helix-turn-helix domain-containing protein [Calothrix sp. 336/3]AKG24183.1 hypothetical protein IJ00_25260 [Calothrix sp. 336/3]
MTTAPVYHLKILGNSTIEISQDELRSLLGEIEAELHRSPAYRRALANAQKLLGDSADQAKQLFKAVSREAIGLAFRQFAQQYAKNSVLNQATESAPNISTSTPESQGDLSQCLTSAKFHTTTENKQLTELPIVTKTSDSLGKNTSNNSSARTQAKWLRKKKVSKTEIAQIAAQKRVDSLKEIGQKLQQARESQGLSLYQLNIYTHVPVHQMEAVETGNWDVLPEDVFVRGFIRVMGNALGMNGTALAATLPTSEQVKSVLPTWYQSKNNSGSKLGFEINPIHLYVGYTALVAGTVGGLSFMSQQGEANRLMNNASTPTTPSVSDSSQKSEPVGKPGIQSSNAGITIGADISPPEAL